MLLGGDGNPSAKVPAATVVVGGYAPTEFAFKSGEKVGTEAAVSPNAGLYKGWGPGPAAAPSKPAGSPSAPAATTVPATGAATPGATPSGAAAPAGTATPAAGTH